MKFNIVFSDQEIPKKITKSIFLAGPSPRTKDVFDWRNNALSLLVEKDFNGTVFVPIPMGKFYGKDDDPSWTYDNQIDWECKAREVSDLIIFWVPRDIKNGMPAFTTNVEFGEDLGSGKITYGRPDKAEKCRYLDNRMETKNLVVYSSLDLLLNNVMIELGDGALRVDGEINVPLFIWETEQFKSWYSQLKKNGNKLIEAKVLHHKKVSNNSVFSFILWVNVWVESEKRFKSNEFIFARKDTSSIIAYYKDEVLKETFIVLVKEFRSAVRNNSGFVYELPGGSSFDLTLNYKENAQHELSEETGIVIKDTSRFKFVNSRQVMATIASHHSQLYKVELTKVEFEKVKKDFNDNKSFGLQDDSEITYLEIVPLSKVMNYDLDYSMIGMIFEGLSI